MPKDPHDQVALVRRYQLPVHHPRAAAEEEAVLRPEVEVEGAEAGVEVHHPEVAGAAGAVEVAGVAGVQD